VKRYYFHLRNNVSQVSVEEQRYFEAENMDEVLKLAKVISESDKPHIVMYVEELDTGRYEYV
jgi:hypothetical protein